MAATPSRMLELGTRAPDFELPDVMTGEIINRDHVAGPKGLLVMFICRHCPYVQHIEKELAALGRAWQGRGIGIAAISANDSMAYPEDSPERLREQADRLGFTFPYLYDESQEVALAYKAACTPDFFLFDRHMALVYRGQFDESRPGSVIPVTGKDLREAMDNLIMGNPVDTPQRPSLGCNIKWRPGIKVT